ncbi:MAG TPA: DUF1801 domain-containing protein [Acidimicrobiia bacterium]|nr:DUF1801 domain-containing protein [Acidimicrobiia bacterium]
MAAPAGSTAIDEYIAEFPSETRRLLEELRAVIARTAPDATETISYAIPTFDLDGKHLVHFAGFANHIGLYPTPGGVEAFADAFSRYKTGKGSVQFPLDEPLPVDLVERIVRHRLGQIRPGSVG